MGCSSGKSVDVSDAKTLPDVWEKKITTFFKLFDADKDGKVSEKDYPGFVEHFVIQTKAKDEDAEGLRDIMKEMWKQLAKYSGAMDSMGVDDFVKAYRAMISQEKDFHIVYENLANMVFANTDTNTDSSMQLNEYQEILRLMGIDTSKTGEAFEAMDTDNDGLLSKAEFAAGLVDFISSKEDTPQKFHFGPLVE